MLTVLNVLLCERGTLIGRFFQRHSLVDVKFNVISQCGKNSFGLAILVFLLLTLSEYLGVFDSSIVISGDAA